MAAKSLALGAVIGLLLIGIVSAEYRRQNHQNQLLCNAHGESSEECADTSSSKKLRAENTEVKVQFFLHNNIKNHEESFELIPNDKKSILNANPYTGPKPEWKFLIPGFPSNGKSPFPKNVVDGYLDRQPNADPDEFYNIIVVDWDRDIMCRTNTQLKNSTYFADVGKKIAEMLIFLSDEDFVSLSKKVHLIGFSLGAHIADETARAIKKHYERKNIIYRFSALDPVSEKFWSRGTLANFYQLRPLIERSFVVYQDVYHTGSTYGMTTQIGDLDFFVNNGHKQPGCKHGWFESSKLSYFQELCDHVYVTEVFAKSINDHTLVGCMGCNDFKAFIDKKCKCEDTPLLGEFADRETVDNYPFSVGMAFITTDDLSKFGTRFENTLLANGEPKPNVFGWKQLC